MCCKNHQSYDKMDRRNPLKDGMDYPVKNVRPVVVSLDLPILGPDSETPKRPPGSPRKNQSDLVSRSEESANNRDAIAKVLRRCMKKHNKMVPTVNNGFERGLKPDYILTALKQQNVLVLAVRCKHRRLPELITARDLKKHAPKLYIRYYVDNSDHFHYERPT